MTDVLAAVFWGALLLTGYAYAGYPALIALLAAVRPRPARRDADHAPPLTVLIAAYDEEDCIAAKLENTLALDYPAGRLQVLVAADGSTDRTAEIVRGFFGRGVELSHRAERAGKYAALKRALPLARGEIVVFSDANNEYHPRALRELAACFADPAVGAVGGAKTVAAEGGALDASEGLYWRYESFIKERESLAGSCVAVAGEILAIRRELFTPLSDDTILDDFMTAMQIVGAGYRSVYAPRARSVERVSASAAEEITRRRKIIMGRVQAMLLSPRYLSWRRPLVSWEVLSHKFQRPLVPIAMIAALAANVALVISPPAAGPGALPRLAPPWGAVALVLQGGFYAAAALGHLLHRRGPLGKALYVATFLVNSNWAALVGIYDYFFGRRSPLWTRVPRR
jgi:cellulose synthase/poly-beta-1,6-N-acetylglucosamine synthase-like glycosyltransferase